jgi:hypothetical protein
MIRVRSRWCLPLLNDPAHTGRRGSRDRDVRKRLRSIRFQALRRWMWCSGTRDGNSRRSFMRIEEERRKPREQRSDDDAAKSEYPRRHRSPEARGSLHLTRHKISCREPSVHATQHRRTMAVTGSANRRLARGQLHRVVRWFRGVGARVARGRATVLHARRRNANSPALLPQQGTRGTTNIQRRADPQPPRPSSRAERRSRSRQVHAQPNPSQTSCGALPSRSGQNT